MNQISHLFATQTARAIENQCYVLAAAQFGRHNEKRESYGHSLAINPWGEVVADAGGYDSFVDQDEKLLSTPKIILCEIDRDEVKSVRERMPIQSHREKSSYSSFLLK